MTSHDPVRELLAERGCPGEMIAGGLAGLVDRWASIVSSIEGGFPLGLDDYLNDMDVRDILAAALAIAPAGEAAASWGRVDSLDVRLRAVTVPSPCLWGSDVESDDDLDPARNWWYYLRPVQLNEELADELVAWGLMDDLEAGA